MQKPHCLDGTIYLDKRNYKSYYINVDAMDNGEALEHRNVLFIAQSIARSEYLLKFLSVNEKLGGL